jgi:RNA 2',3'-cyclic 3'-phosphodiesterase
VSDKTHQSAIVVIPPEPLWEPIQAIRRQYDKYVRRWMPHFTMVYPFRPRSQFDDVAKTLTAVCGRVQPFEVSLLLFKYFCHGGSSYTLWLAPDPVEPFVRLQERLLSVTPDCIDTSQYAGGFTPHLSVGQVRDAQQMEHLKDQLQAAWQPLVFKVDSVSLLWRNDPPDDVFRVDRTIPLAGQASS